MEIDNEFLVLGFIAFGGFIAIMPLVLIGKLPPIKILKIIGLMLILALGFGLFYTLISDHQFTEIMFLQKYPISWPSKAISTPYIAIITSVALLPFSIGVSIYTKKAHKT